MESIRVSNENESELAGRCLNLSTSDIKSIRLKPALRYSETLPCCAKYTSWRKPHSNAPEMTWKGRSVAREIMSEIAVEETRGRLQHSLETKRVASLTGRSSHRRGPRSRSTNADRLLRPRNGIGATTRSPTLHKLGCARASWLSRQRF
jgi:hypothetical protein